MNYITEMMKRGTVGELLVQLRLLEHGVQAAPPIKDSGNDLIAIRKDIFKAIQVKTTITNRLRKGRLPKMYHILAMVKIEHDNKSVYLDKSLIYLIPRNEVNNAPTTLSKLKKFLMTPAHVDSLFSKKNEGLQNELLH